MAAALEMAVASTCINPFGTHEDRVKRDKVLSDARLLTRKEHFRNDYLKLIEQMISRAQKQSGVFGYLNNLDPTRGPNAAEFARSLVFTPA